jgi:hypothetical protein
VRLLTKCLCVLPFAATLLVGSATFSTRAIDRPSSEQDNSWRVMLILRGIANAEKPRGQLDDQSALAYAGRLGFKGEVLDIAGDSYSGSPQVETALERIRADRSIAAIYGFSGGGYNVRLIWKQLEPPHQERIRKVVVIGSPGVTKDDFPGSAEVLIMGDPPEGHMAGPRRLLESLDAERGSSQ